MSDNKVLLRTEDGKKVYILTGSDKKELMIIDESSNPPKTDSFDLVPPGKMDNMDLSIDDLTSQNASLTQQKGTTQTLTFNGDGTVQKVTDTDAQSVVVRESVYTYPDADTIVEVKTVGTNVTTYTYHLDTLVTEVS